MHAMHDDVEKGGVYVVRFCLDVICRNSNLRTSEYATYVEILGFLIITEPQSSVELFDTLVAAFHNLVDGRI
jgi:hypothetical protein